MSAWKQFLSQDIIVEPFELNKSFTFPASQFTDSNVDIDRYLGINGNFEFTQSLTGNNNDQYGVLIYNSAKELYYSNFLSSSYGSPLQTQSLLPGDDTAGDVFRGSPDSSGRYDNYLQTTTNGVRFFPTGSSDKIVTLSIPSRLWGDYVQPGSFVYTCVSESISYTITDDSQGNLYTNGAYCGNIIYPHGLAVFTSLMDNKPPSTEGYGISKYGEDMYGGGITVGALLSTNATCSFSSSFNIYETQYKATISENDFNFTQNPSILSGSADGRIYPFATSSFFSPYVTTVGLYDNAQNLLAVGKLSQPLPTSRTTDTTIFINIDR